MSPGIATHRGPTRLGVTGALHRYLYVLLNNFDNRILADMAWLRSALSMNHLDSCMSDSDTDKMATMAVRDPGHSQMLVAHL
jgi:hypothetical protein